MRRFLLTTVAATAVMLGGCIVITDGHSSNATDGSKVRYIGGDTTAQLVLRDDECAHEPLVLAAKTSDGPAEALPAVAHTPDADSADDQLCNLSAEG